MLKIRKVEKSLNQVIKEEISSYGHVSIEKVEIYPNENIIEINGTYGEHFADGDVANWSEDFRLSYSNGRPLEFIKGMFYQELSKNF